MFLEHQLIIGSFFSLSADKLFCQSAPESLESLAAIKQTKCFDKDVVVSAAGDVPRFVYILSKGQAQLSLDSHSDLARLVKPNEIFGLIEMMANSSYKMNLETITPCVFEIIEKSDFTNFLHNEPEICLRLVKSLGSNLQKSQHFLCSIC